MREFRSENLNTLRRLPESLATALRHHAEVVARPWMQKANEQEQARRDTLRTLNSIRSCGEIVSRLETEMRSELMGLPPARKETDALRAEIGILRAWCRQGPLLAVCAAGSAKDREARSLELLQTLAREAVTLGDQSALIALVENAGPLFRSAFGAAAVEKADAALLEVMPEGSGPREVLQVRQEVAEGTLRLREDAEAAINAVEGGGREVSVRSWDGNGSQAIKLEHEAAARGVMVAA